MRFDWTWRDYPFEGTFSDLILGDETQESDVINSNAYIHLNHLQDQVFVKARDLFDWRSINWQKPEIIAFTNTPGECNAIVPIDSYQISFGRASSGRCVNAAYSSVVVHEYAHVLFQSLFHVGSMPWSIWLPPTDLGAYGEGMADALSAITMSTYCMGRKFFADRECGRDLREARRFPIEDGDPHIRGMALSGAWYDLLTLTPAANRQDIALRLYMQTLIQNDQFMGPQLVNYVLQADCELYAGAHLDLIRQAFVINRGFPIDDWGASLTASSCR